VILVVGYAGDGVMVLVSPEHIDDGSIEEISIALFTKMFCVVAGHGRLLSVIVIDEPLPVGVGAVNVVPLTPDPLHVPPPVFRLF
jgi:hypothetical protein